MSGPLIIVATILQLIIGAPVESVVFTINEMGWFSRVLRLPVARLLFVSRIVTTGWAMLVCLTSAVIATAIKTKSNRCFISLVKVNLPSIKVRLFLGIVK